jgi:hypothetical protein
VAHSGQIEALGINGRGDKIATASEKGTLIRIWDTITG